MDNTKKQIISTQYVEQVTRSKLARGTLPSPSASAEEERRKFDLRQTQKGNIGTQKEKGSSAKSET